jgi:flagellar assembly protein FliH
MPIIRDDEKEKHLIANFVFKNLDEVNSNSEDDEDFYPFPVQEMQISPKEENVQPETDPNNSQSLQPQVEAQDYFAKDNVVIQTLLEKVDKLTAELLSLQQKLTAQETLFKQEMKSVKEDSFQQGFQAGLTKAREELENSYNSGLSQLQNSITKIDELGTNLNKVTETIEKELIHTSIAIAKEILDSEISFNSGQVAINLSKALIKQLEEAEAIEIKVNPQDFSTVKIGLSDLSHVKIIEDSAVVKGGVIISSDIGSIEGNIMERYKKLKSDALAKTGL